MKNHATEEHHIIWHIIKKHGKATKSEQRNCCSAQRAFILTTFWHFFLFSAYLLNVWNAWVSNFLIFTRQLWKLKKNCFNVQKTRCLKNQSIQLNCLICMGKFKTKNYRKSNWHKILLICINVHQIEGHLFWPTQILGVFFKKFIT